MKYDLRLRRLIDTSLHYHSSSPRISRVGSRAGEIITVLPSESVADVSIKPPMQCRIGCRQRRSHAGIYMVAFDAVPVISNILQRVQPPVPKYDDAEKICAKYQVEHPHKNIHTASVGTAASKSLRDISALLRRRSSPMLYQRTGNLILATPQYSVHIGVKQ